MDAERSTVTAPPSAGPPRELPRKASATEAPPRRDVAWWLFWGFAAALLVPVWMGNHFPSEDGLAHLAWTEVYRALGVADAPWRPYYERSVSWNTPNLSYFGLQYALGALIEPHLAQRLIVSALIAGWAASTAVLSFAYRGRISIGAFASLLLIQSSWLYGGYFSFLIGVPPLLLALALVARMVGRLTPDSPWELAVLSLLGVIAYYSHLVTAAVFLVLVAVAVPFLRPRRRAVSVTLSALPATVLVASYLVPDSLGSGGLQWEPVTKTIARFAGMAFFRGFAAPTLEFWVALASFVAVAGALCLVGAREWRRSGMPASSRLVLTLAACLVVLYAVSPDAVGDGSNLKARFQLVVWAWLLPALPEGMSGRFSSGSYRAALTGLVSALLAWQIVQFASRARRFDAAYDDVVIASAARVAPGSAFARTSDYEHEAFDGSFIKVLAHAPEDFALHCACVLVDGYHPSTAFYWVRARTAAVSPPPLRIQIGQWPGEPVTVRWSAR